MILSPPNRYRTLIIDEDADFDKEYENNEKVKKNRNLSEEKCNPDLRRPNVMVNQNPQNDDKIYKTQRISWEFVVR